MPIIPYKIIRSRRRTLAIQIQADATLIIRAPLFATQRTINKFIAVKKGWIQEKQSLMRRKKAEASPKRFIDGEKFQYLGEVYHLCITDQYSPEIIQGNTFILSPEQVSRAPALMAKWYKKQAKEYLTGRVEYYAKLKGLSFRGIRITGAEKRWGSCSSQGNISFSWRLIMAPPKVIDYVVVHELVHIIHHNHSPAFWSEVKKTFPDHQKYRAWLRDNGHRLIL